MISQIPLRQIHSSAFTTGIIRLLSACLLLFICNQFSMAQSKLSEAVTFNTTVTGDFVINGYGGVKQGFAYIGKEDLLFGLNTGTAGWWENGYFFVHGLNTHGVGPSEKFTGDLQIFDNIEAGDHTGLFEFWYSQQIGKFSFLVGQHDMNTEFLGSKYSAILMNSSFGIMPTLSLNMPISIFPLAAPGFILKYEADNNIIYRAAIYDGNPGNFDDNRYNLNVRLNKLEGFFYIGEIQYNQQDGYREVGNYKIGSYYHSGLFPDYTDSLNTIKGNYGFYILADRALFAKSLHAGRGLCVFAQLGVTDPQRSMVNRYYGGGFRYHGILPERYKDQLGLGLAYISLSKNYLKSSSEALSFETAMECTYIFHFGSGYTIQPSLQYLVNPGAVTNTENCLAGILRFSISL